MSTVYRIEFTTSAAKLIEKLPTDVRKRVVTKVETLADNPRPPGVEKLAGEGNAYRVRIGDYRILYEIHDRVLVVLAVNVWTQARGLPVNHPAQASSAVSGQTRVATPRHPGSGPAR